MAKPNPIILTGDEARLIRAYRCLKRVQRREIHAQVVAAKCLRNMGRKPPEQQAGEG